MKRIACISSCCLLATVLLSGCRTTKTVDVADELPAAPYAVSMAPVGFTPEIQVVLASAPKGPADLWTDDMFETAAKAAPKKPAKPAKTLGPQADTSGYIDTTDDRKGAVKACAPGFKSEKPENVFDNSMAKWCLEGKSAWIEYHYAEKMQHQVVAYTVMSANDMPTRDPKDWKLLGSNDGETWTEVDSREGQEFKARFEKRLFEVKTPGEYGAYRLEVSLNHGDVSSQMAGMELLIKK